MTTPWIIAFAALWALVLMLAFLMLGTLRRLLPLLGLAEDRISESLRSMRRGGLPVGTSIPAFSVEKMHGGTLSEADLNGVTSAVLFLGANCPACERLSRDLSAGYVPDLGANLVVVSDNPDQARQFAGSVSVPVIADPAKSLATIFESDRTPHLFVTDERARVVAIGSPNDWDVVAKLLVRADGGGVTDQEARGMAATAS